MAKLEFKYSSKQEHQIAAIDAVTRLFEGQQFMTSNFTVQKARHTKGFQHGLFASGELGGQHDLFEMAELDDVIGYANSLHVSARQLEENLHAVQEDNCLPPTSVLTNGHLRDFTIEMETGTGKTYVYIRSIYELHKQYGISKFVIVVPSVAIREGVMKSFETMRAHFETLYDRTPLDVFVYDSKDMGPVGNFATSSSIQVMVINIDAFNKGLEKDGVAKKGNLFHERSEKLIGGHSPRELVASCAPVVIIDEPQSVDNTVKAKAAIRSLNPLFVLRYSATHKESYNKIYRLTPVDAFERGLVKGICVDSVTSEEDLNGAYVRLESASSKSNSIKLTIDVRQKDGTQKRKIVSAKVGSSLYDLSNENSDYEAGWIVSNFSTAEGEEFVEFQNGEVLEIGAAVGDVADQAIKRAQIRRTIENHFQRQFELYPRGIKVLSLFFIDQVDRYRIYEPEEHSGLYAEMFEQEYASTLGSRAAFPVRKACGLPANATWRECFEHIGYAIEQRPSAVHDGYFSKDGKGRLKDTRGTTAADISTYELIMRKKESLVSFPVKEEGDEENAGRRVSFIFSHSALKEGWDNPNVFQICTLVDTKDELTKRQKIGRGLRLCVDRNGERCHDPEVNILTVIANESYESFAKGLQSELETDGARFGVLTPESFTRVRIEDEGANEEKLGYAKSKQIYDSFVDAGLVDGSGKITQELKKAAENGSVVLPEELAPAKEQVQAIILHKAQKLQIRDKKKEVPVELQKDVTLSPAFQELWEKIRQRTRFEVDVDSERIITAAIEGIQSMPKVRAPQVTSSRADLNVTGAGVDAEGIGNSQVNVFERRVYDLPDPIAEIQDAVGLTRRTIKAILAGCGRYDEFAVNPAVFLAQVSAKIVKAKNDEVSRGIKYVKLPESEWYTMRDLELEDYTAYEGQNAWKPNRSDKCAYSYVVFDSAGVERSYAKALDAQEEVLVYAKLPSKFKIDTPLGTYNPDWAYVEEVNGERRVYFVTETKGGKNGEPALRDAERMKIKCAQEHFATLELGDDFVYDVKTTYETACL